MKTIGLVGGMSWESSAVYYRDLNLGMRERLGGLSSPRLALTTVDFAEVTHLEDDERWDQVGALLADAARGVERAGADFLLLCTTTFHKVADQVEEAVGIPLLHLGDVVAEAVRAAGVETVGLIGTKVAMSESFFVDRLEDHGLSVVVPDASHHDFLNDAIYEELVHGVVLPRTRSRAPPSPTPHASPVSPASCSMTWASAASPRPAATAGCTSTSASSRAGSSSTCGTPRSPSAASSRSATTA